MKTMGFIFLLCIKFGKKSSEMRNFLTKLNDKKRDIRKMEKYRLLWIFIFVFVFVSEIERIIIGFLVFAH